jgi:prophage regulatory protein
VTDTPLTPLPERRFLRLSDVIRLVGLSKTSIYNAEKAGTFPARRKIGIRAVRWDSREIDRWMRSQQEATKQ